MPIPEHQSFMLPILQIAAKSETSVPFTEVEIAAMFAFSQEEREQMLPSGEQRVSDHK
jgi:restriction system protein